MVVSFTTTYAISAYHLFFSSNLDQGEVYTLSDSICQLLATGRWFSPVSSTNKNDRHNITEILLKVALNTIKQRDKQTLFYDLSIEVMYLLFFILLLHFEFTLDGGGQSIIQKFTLYGGGQCYYTEVHS